MSPHRALVGALAAGGSRRRARRTGLGSTLWRRRGGNADLKLAHEAQQVRSLKSQRSRRPRAIAADLRQGRLDQATFELADGTVKADGGAGRGRWDNRCGYDDRLREAVSRYRGRARARQRSHEHLLKAKAVPRTSAIAIQEDTRMTRAMLHQRLGSRATTMPHRMGNGDVLAKTPRGPIRVPVRMREPERFPLRLWWRA